MSEVFDFELAELLRKQVPHDESIHSTLIRTLLAYDPNIKPIGVVGKSGLWMDAPFVQKDYQHIFSRYPDHVLLEAIDVGLSVDGKDNGLFDNPAYYTCRIESTFFSNRKTRTRVKSSKRIRYCLSCIEESIDSVGYGYFRHFWERSCVCLIHAQPLKELPELGFSKTLKAVKRLLNAKDCSQAISLKAEPKVTSIYHRNSTWENEGRYVFPIKLAPGCMIPVFSEWVYNNNSKFDKIELREFSEKVVGQYFNYFEYLKLDYRRDFAAIFLLCAEYEPELLNSFMRNQVNLIGLELGPRKQGVIREIIAKSTEYDCCSCKEESCVMKTHSGTFDFDVTGLDFKKILKNSYNMARISMQGRPVRTSKGSIWGAIDLSPEVIDYKALTKIEFKLNQEKGV